MYKIIIHLAFTLLTCLTAIGQEKGICKKNVSITIQNFIKTNYATAKHLNYYKEQDKGNTFIECEFKVEKVEYSLKFVADSLFETEISMAFADIPAYQQKLIKSNLDSLYANYKVLECQEVNPKTNPHYEINIKTKSDNYFELFYNKEGTLIRKNAVIIKPISSQF